MTAGKTLDEIRKAFVAREKSVVLVTDGGLLAEHEELSKELEKALAATRKSLADDGGVRGIAERIQALEAQIAEATVTFKLRGIGRNRFRRLIAEHPDDKKAFDEETFPAALIAACSLDPVLTEAEAGELADILTDAQFDELFDAAWRACREVDGVPFSVLASVTTGS